MFSSEPREQGTAIFILTISAESLQGTKQHHLVKAMTTHTYPCSPLVP